MPTNSSIALSRLGIGLLQGIAGYWLYRSTSITTTEQMPWAALYMLTLLLPVLLISSLGHMPLKRVLIWGGLALVSISAFAYYDAWRADLSPYLSQNPALAQAQPFPSSTLLFGATIGFAIMQILILAAAFDHKAIATYTSYFDTAWKLALQLVFATLFIGVLWLILLFGARLFMLLQLDFLQRLLDQTWFNIPLTTLAFAFALHVTDMRPHLITGIRTLLLSLMSWLLPVIVLIVGGFLLSMPWTGLAPLWATRHASSVLLTAAALLVMLINAAYQNGLIAAQITRLIRHSARIACLLLLPLISIAIYSLSLRVNAYGWTYSRVIAASGMLLATLYALTYSWAAIKRGIWLQHLARYNILIALALVLLLTLLLSPLLDPSRISVASQVRQLNHDKINSAPYDYLRLHGERYGIAALQALSNAPDPDIRQQASHALQRMSEALTALSPAMRMRNIRVFPSTASLPDTFFQQQWNNVNAVPQCLSVAGKPCSAYLLDFNGSGTPQILLWSADQPPAIIEQTADRSWHVSATLALYSKACRLQLQRALESGNYRLLLPRFKDLEIGGQRLRIAAEDKPECSAEAK